MLFLLRLPRWLRLRGGANGGGYFLEQRVGFSPVNTWVGAVVGRRPATG